MGVPVKPRVIILGGMKFNVPRKVHDLFEVVKHYEQGRGLGMNSPAADLILHLYEYSNSADLQILTRRLPDATVVRTRASWSHMATRLLDMGLMPPEPVAPVEKGLEVEIQTHSGASQPPNGSVQGVEILVEETNMAPIEEDLQKLDELTRPPQPASVPVAPTVQVQTNGDTGIHPTVLNIPIPAEYAYMLQAARKLEQEKGILERQIQAAEERIKAINAELDIYDPIVNAEKMFAKAVSRAKERLTRMGT